MAVIDGVLPADFDAAQLQGILENRETDHNGLIEMLATRVRSSGSLEGKLFRNIVNAAPKKITDEKGDLPLNHMSGYALKFMKCRFGEQFCLTPKEREFGKSREQTIINGIFAGKGRENDKNFMSVLCGPVEFCPTEENGGKVVVDSSMQFIDPNNEGLTPDKLKAARRYLKGGNGGMIDACVLAHNDALENLDNYDQFKNFDCTYGRGSALFGDVNRYPEFYGLQWREIMNHTLWEMDGTDAIEQEPVLLISPNYTAAGEVDPDYEVHWIPMYDKMTIGYEPWHELCISMHDNLPGKLKKLLTIQYEYGYGLTRMRSKNVVWIGVMVERNPCIKWKGDPYNRKFPRVVDGMISQENG